MDAESLTTPPVSSRPLARPAFRYAEWGLAALCLFLFFFRLGSIHLFDLDEALYVTCARQMLVTGDIITPRLNARPPARPNEQTSPFFEKPILVYWCAALSMRLFGVSETAARLPAALATLLTTALIYYAGRRWFGRRAGLLAAAVYASAPMTLADARQMTTDGLLVLWLTIALLAFEALRPVPNTSRTPTWLLAAGFWIACALSVLTKGAIGLLLPALVIGTYLLWDRLSLRLRRRTFSFRVRWNPRSFLTEHLKRLRPLLGLALLFVLAAPWHYLVWRAGERAPDGRDFYQEYIIHQHIGRFQGADTVHNMPLPTYFLYFLLGFFPWACFAPAAFHIHYKRVETSSVSVVKFLLAWFWAIFVFYSLGAAKLPTYIVPAYPAAALLIGYWLDRAISEQTFLRSLRRGVTGAALISGILLAAALILLVLSQRKSLAPSGVNLIALGLTLILFVGAFMSWALLLRNPGERQRWGSVLTLLGTMALLIGFGATVGYGVIEKEVIAPYQQIAEDARSDAKAGLPVVFYHIIPRRPSMLYYARDYSPLERKEPLVLPTLRNLISPDRPEADVITSQAVLDRELTPEVASNSDVSLSILQRHGDWLLLRVRFHLRGSIPVLKHETRLRGFDKPLSPCGVFSAAPRSGRAGGVGVREPVRAGGLWISARRFNAGSV
ncbi:MAG TPA: glycosyltransferase family 39 protein [Chthonomonadaceae bacterium]|nr:glycosyltransferase family 39 protein [Chthonomonadaceae bacterium]